MKPAWLEYGDGQRVRGKCGNHMLRLEVGGFSNKGGIPSEGDYNAEISRQSTRCSGGVIQIRDPTYPQGKNARADLLSKLASTKKASNYHSVVEEVIPYPSLTLQVRQDDWRTPLVDYTMGGSRLKMIKSPKR